MKKLQTEMTSGSDSLLSGKRVNIINFKAEYKVEH